MKIFSFKGTPFFLLTLLLSVSCEEEERKFGGDGAVLKSIDLSDAVGLVSVQDYKQLVESDFDRSFPLERLKKVKNDGLMEDVAFTIEGNQNGGFDKYAVNDINEKYFLISFYLRHESYFVEKESGAAVQSSFIRTINMSGFGSTWAAAISNNTFYYYDYTRNGLYRVDDYLQPTANETLIAGRQFGELQFDKNGNLYLLSSPYAYYLKDGQPEEIFVDFVGVWNDLQGNLKVMFEDGKIYTAVNGELQYDTSVGTKVYPWDKVAAFNFPSLEKTYMIFTSGETGALHLYDLTNMKSVANLRDLDQSFEVEEADAYDQTVVLLGRSERQIKINVSELSFDEVLLSGDGLNSSDRVENFCAMNANRSFYQVCESAGEGSCYQMLKSIDGSGNVTYFEGERTLGVVVKLNAYE